MMTNENNKPWQETVLAMEKVMAEINLTVSESKRLIAKSMVRQPLVQEKLKHGMIILTRGTTNTYIAEEMLGFDHQHGAFLTGHFVPSGVRSLTANVKEKVGEIVLVDGRPVDLTYAAALKQLKEGDIVIKGGNLLNYRQQQAAVCIGAPDGGTTFRFLPYVGKGKAQLVVPIGLEKETSFDLSEIASALAEKSGRLSRLTNIHVYDEALLFTEIEALQQWGKVEVFPNGIGGVSGREGGLSLVVAGPRQEVEKVLEVVHGIQGEPAF